MKSSAQTIEDYINEILSDERKAAIRAVREIILSNLPDGYVEVMNWGMITYEVPLTTYPGTYNKKPLMYAALANHKNHMAIYLCGIYCIPGMREDFEKEFNSTGKKLNMGASCVRFKKLEDLPLGLIGKTIASVEVKKLIEAEQKAHQKRKKA